MRLAQRHSNSGTMLPLNWLKRKLAVKRRLVPRRLTKMSSRMRLAKREKNNAQVTSRTEAIRIVMIVRSTRNCWLSPPVDQMTAKARQKQVRIITAGHQRIDFLFWLFWAVSIANRCEFTGSRAWAKPMKLKGLPSFLVKSAALGILVAYEMLVFCSFKRKRWI